MRSGLGIGIRQRPDKAILIDAPHDVADGLGLVMAEERGSDGTQVHGVAHGGGRTAVARNGFHRHGGADVALAHAAKLFRNDQAQKTVLGQELKILAGIEKLLIALDGVGAHFLFAERYKRRLQLFLTVVEYPLRVPFKTEPPEILFSPFLL